MSASHTIAPFHFCPAEDFFSLAKLHAEDVQCASLYIQLHAPLLEFYNAPLLELCYIGLYIKHTQPFRLLESSAQVELHFNNSGF